MSPRINFLLQLPQIATDSAQQALDKHYVEILEKTNQQLSAGWWTPFGVTVAWLTALITIGGIVAAVLLYRQSQDYQRKTDALVDRFGEMISEKERLAEAQIEAFALNNRMAGERFNELMNSVRQSADQTTGETKEKFLSVLGEIEKAEESALGDFQKVSSRRRRVDEWKKRDRPVASEQRRHLRMRANLGSSGGCGSANGVSI
jgi:hypothetical protein